MVPPNTAYRNFFYSLNMFWGFFCPSFSPDDSLHSGIMSVLAKFSRLLISPLVVSYTVPSFWFCKSGRFGCFRFSSGLALRIAFLFHPPNWLLMDSRFPLFLLVYMSLWLRPKVCWVSRRKMAQTHGKKRGSGPDREPFNATFFMLDKL